MTWHFDRSRPLSGPAWEEEGVPETRIRTSSQSQGQRYLVAAHEGSAGCLCQPQKTSGRAPEAGGRGEPKTAPGKIPLDGKARAFLPQLPAQDAN